MKSGGSWYLINIINQIESFKRKRAKLIPISIKLKNTKITGSMWSVHSVHTDPRRFCLGVEPPTKFLKGGPGGGLTGSQFLGGAGGLLGKRGVTFFQRRCIFSTKKQLKSGMFNGKKVYKQKSFALS